MNTGQELQHVIVRVLVKWRCYKIVFMYDIVKMFRQILIDARDQDWLRIIFEFAERLQQFRLATVTYGTACAPYQALRTIY